MGAGQTCTGSGDSFCDSSLLANIAMVPTICVVGETRGNITTETNPAAPAPATRNKLTTPNLGSAQSDSSNLLGHLPAAGLSPDAA